MPLVPPILALTAVAILGAGGQAVSTELCGAGGLWGADCSVSNSGSQVDVGASVTDPGNSGPPRSGQDSPGESAPAEPPPSGDSCTRQSCPFTVVVVPDVTLADLASFRPAQPSLTGEPTGFGVVGAPTNVVAAASEQFMTGTILGWDVTVRFTPAGYVFDYGDGTSARFTTGGKSWASLGQAQFTPTATSHVYRERGTYPVSVTVQYSASVDFGSGLWRPVTGFVTATGGGYDVQVVEARTALVDQTCAEDPRGPGC